MVPIGSICAATRQVGHAQVRPLTWAHADAIALTDPVVLVVGGRGDVDLVEVAFDAARSGD
jgi:predicted NBD/HSP70 family sugar kinase